VSEKTKAVEEVILKAKPESAEIIRVLTQQGLAASFRQYWVEWKRHTVLVLGFSGAGKTSMLRSTFGIVEPEEDLGKPTGDVRLYMLRPGKTTFRVSDTPGHPILRRRLDKEIARLVRGDYQGVIDVVAYGYNESKHLSSLVKEADPESLARYKNEYQPVSSTGQVNARYVRRERELELAYLKSWARRVGRQSKLKWVITVVNKADLWRKHRAEALDHYQGNGEYAAVFKEEFPDIPHDVCPLSCSTDGFYNLRPPSPGPKFEAWRREMSEALVSKLHSRLS